MSQASKHSTIIKTSASELGFSFCGIAKAEFLEQELQAKKEFDYFQFQFTELEEAAGKFREETGLTKSQTKDISNQVRQIRAEFAGLGIEAKNVYDTVSALKTEFSDSIKFSKAIVENITLLNKNFSIAEIIIALNPLNSGSSNR